jgi:valyl-tRNA synthetase
MSVKLGSKVKDSLTGFTGIATARTEWLYGCTRIAIEPQELHDGKPIETQWFDEQRVEVVLEDKPKVSKDSSATSGGPQKDPHR